jgi:zinc/manganese transport system substrate-binding protein
MITILISRLNSRNRGRASASAIAVALILLLALGACGSGTDGAGSETVQVVATNSIWGEVVSEIVGDQGEVEVLIPRGVDTHDYQVTPRQLAGASRADLVVANGLGLEGGLADALDAAREDGANVFEVAPELDPLPFADGDGLDPLVWFDPERLARAADLIAQRLAEIAPDGDWEARAMAYAEELEETDAAIEELLESIPAGNRKLVTNHQALGYLAARYDLDVVGVVVPGGSTLDEPSSADLAALVSVIDEEGISTIFAETTQPTRLAEAVAKEVGRDVAVVELYTESLGDEGSPASTLTALLIEDATRIALGLR